MKRTAIIVLLAAETLLLAGCQKVFFGKAGEEIRFSASAGPAGTKTAYSNAFVTSDDKTIERIDWQVGDQIRIWSDNAEDRYHAGKHYADYKVWGEISNSGARSTAHIVNAGNYTAENPNYDPGVPVPQDMANDNVNGLVWGEAGTYSFWGVYPAPADKTLPSGSVSGTTCTLEASIPADQGTGDPANIKDYGYLTAAAVGVGKGANVTLEFEPAFTAFEIQLLSDADLTIDRFTLSSAGKSLSGSFSVDYDGTARTFGDTNTAIANTVFAQNLGNLGPETAPVTLTLFTQPMNEDQVFDDLAVTLSLTVGGVSEERTLRLLKDGVGIPFAPLKKHRIKMLKIGDKWTATVIPFGVETTGHVVVENVYTF